MTPADELKNLSDRYAAEHNADLFFLNAPIGRIIAEKVIDNLRALERRPNGCLILVTSGGDPHAAYIIARAFQNMYEKFTVVIPGYCKSAGTLLAIGAHALQMRYQSELGPLDVQVLKKDELGEYQSGLTVNSAIEALQEIEFSLFDRFMIDLLHRSGGSLSTKTLAEICTSLSLGIVQPIASKIEADRIGEDRRSMNIAKEYAIRLNNLSNLLKFRRNDIDMTLEMLTSGYPSHGFVIDWAEAEALFSCVEPIPALLTPVVDSLGRGAQRPLGDDDPSKGVWMQLSSEIGSAIDAESVEGGEFNAKSSGTSAHDGNARAAEAENPAAPQASGRKRD